MFVLSANKKSKSSRLDFTKENMYTFLLQLYVNDIDRVQIRFQTSTISQITSAEDTLLRLFKVSYLFSLKLNISSRAVIIWFKKILPQSVNMVSVLEAGQIIVILRYILLSRDEETIKHLFIQVTLLKGVMHQKMNVSLTENMCFYLSEKIQTHDLCVASTMLWSASVYSHLSLADSKHIWDSDDKQKWDAAEVNNTKSQLDEVEYEVLRAQIHLLVKL